MLDGGELAEALEDFTGGIAEPIDLVAGQYSEDAEKREDLFKTMKKSIENRALMAAAIPVSSAGRMGSTSTTAQCTGMVNIHGLVQERRNSSALAMELRLSCTNPLICSMARLCRCRVQCSC